jgi:hypothetical protein
MLARVKRQHAAAAFILSTPSLLSLALAIERAERHCHWSSTTA